MDFPDSAPPGIHDADAVAHALRLTVRARELVSVVRVGLQVVGRATAWQSRAADAFQIALGDTSRRLVDVEIRVDDAAGELRAVARRLALSTGAGAGAPVGG
ncbi:hypothetical protein [Microbacterium telephonicum]|uniref:Uncharacterized protein n=1 Tax=Microbacterium telephonicum TaxID=1714841 RepID=A0A498C9A1_9MICO|nr:hypothetical protein [Microbacterium telephonicum]RLK52113.1 hypothetical protein C7474_0039 [Microbacterium telephonicum]